jgi:hypothetical protein
MLPGPSAACCVLVNPIISWLRSEILSAFGTPALSASCLARLGRSKPRPTNPVRTLVTSNRPPIEPPPVLENRVPLTSSSVASESLRNMNMISLASSTRPEGSLGNETASSTASFVVPPEVSRGQTADQVDACAAGLTKPVK